MFTSDKVDTVLQTGDGREISMILKPYVLEFLNDMDKKYEVIIYSSWNNNYLQAIITYLEKTKKYFSYCFDENFCLFANVSSGIKCLDFMSKKRSTKNIVSVETYIKMDSFASSSCGVNRSDITFL